MPANRLAAEKSPYLQQHAHNPVDWFPWGPEALNKARAEGKPIFLSVGYSTCHWCHVMERESFENESIAAQLNRSFVSVKVDREERPDIDRIYMSYVQAATGSGGWPMSVWLTPEGKPFVGGTYFPPESRYGRPGFAEVLERIASAWSTERDRIEQSTGAILRQLEQMASTASTAVPGGMPGRDAVAAAYETCARFYDARLGGFGAEPKFPRPVLLEFLLRYWAGTNDAHALDMVRHTLRMMSLGGMNDQLGGGFHRYSVDAYWFVPHFEKMLYDQAQLVSVLTEVFQITGDAESEREVRRVCDYVLRELTDAEGGFYSAEDADSAPDPAHPEQKSEGAFYLWSAEEVARVAGGERGRLLAYRFGMQPDGNVENDPHGEFTGRNILFGAHGVEQTAHHFDLPTSGARQALDEGSAMLLAARTRRPRPHLDDKVLASWNGLMIGALARAGAALGEARYTDAARRAADFLVSHMWDRRSGVLLRRYRAGDAAIPGFLDDYAFFARALVDLYETGFERRYLDLAVAITERMRELFEDRENGGFFSSAAAPDLLLRMKDDYDGAEPSGNAVAALVLLRLERITGRSDFGDAARRLLAAFGERLRTQGFGLPLMLCALDEALAVPRQVVIAGTRDGADTRALLSEVSKRFQPFRVTLFAEDAPAEAPRLPAIDGRATAYVCQNFVCQLPVTEPNDLRQLLN